MKKTILAFILLLSTPTLWSQNLPFEQAYQVHSSLPQGILETVSWTQTRFHDMDNSEERGCLEMPQPYGVMGVFDDGANYFKENGNYIAQLSGISVAQQKLSVELQIKAYASAFEQIYLGLDNLPESKRVYQTLIMLSEIPDSGRINLYARDAQVYEIMKFINDPDFANENSFTAQNYNLIEAFGAMNLQVLSADRIEFTEEGIETAEGLSYMPQTVETRSADYGPAIWNPAGSCNYGTSRNGASISAVTIHTVQGSYSGCISWFQNCNANVSAHYVVRSSDGQVTQCVREIYRAWHVGNSNNYAVGIEHEGWINQSSWYTSAMYNSSAALTRSIADKYGINRKRLSYFPWSATTYFNQSSIPGECVRIKGHQHFPSQSHTDPGPNWNWDHYHKLVNNNTSEITYTSANGTLYDSGGSTGNYGNDERKIWVIKPADANSVTLNFQSFNVENTWDYLYIYDGDNVFAPRIGRYTGINSPGIVSSTGGAITVEFRSECATNLSGWKATWTADVPIYDNTAPTTSVSVPTDWITSDFEASFIDADETGGSGLAKSFYQVLFFDGEAWKANPKRGFYGDNFDGTSIDTLWTSHVGNWGISTNNKLEQSDISVENSNIYASLKQDLSNRYLYVWNGKISGEAGTNRRAGLHFFCSDATQYERENSYLVYFRTGGNPDPNNNNKVQIYKATGNALSLKKSVNYTINPDQWYEYIIAYDRVTGEMHVYVNGNLVAEWTDPTPIESGNSVSFRNGTSNYQVDNFKVYRTRYPNVTVTVGPGNNTDIPFQNTNPSTPAAKVKSIVMDNAGNLSEIAQEFVNVDWTKPKDLIVNDGASSDIDTVYSTTLQGNWGTAYDPHSGIAAYKYAIGTTPGTDDIVQWTNNGSSADFSTTLTELNSNQVYYISILAKNGAGIVDTASSDGQRYIDGQLSFNENLLQEIEMYPNPTVNELQFKNLESETEVYIYDMKGQLVIKTKVNSKSNKIDVSKLAQASYNVMIKFENQFIVRQLIKN